MAVKDLINLNYIFLKKELNRKTIHKETNYLDSKSNGGRNEFSLSSFQSYV